MPSIQFATINWTYGLSFFFRWWLLHLEFQLACPIEHRCMCVLYWCGPWSLDLVFFLTSIDTIRQIYDFANDSCMNLSWHLWGWGTNESESINVNGWQTFIHSFIRTICRLIGLADDLIHSYGDFIRSLFDSINSLAVVLVFLWFIFNVSLSLLVDLRSTL